ncbi:MAG: hypothetical protein J7513_06205 [Solirubrobacteraceae bacterium]|nr:hypothetical protein [Solirubrobacteraceae bacterium]
MTSAAPASAPEAPTRAARAGALMALSTLAMAGASAIQAVLYLGEYGATARTDAFFAAFAVYQVVGVFTQATRVSSVPLLVGDRAIGMLRFFGAMAVVALPIVIACGPLAGPVSSLLAPSATGDAHDLATTALRVLGLAMILQLGAAGAATLLGMRDRFESVAAAYAVGAFAGLVTFLLVRTHGELALAWSMLAMAVVTAGWSAWSLARVRREEVASGVGGGGLAAIGDHKNRFVVQCIQTAGDLLGRSVVYFVINAFFLVTLAVVGREGGAGATTVLSYAYLLASYLVAGTSTAVGISRAPDMVRGAQDEWDTVVADTVPHGYRYAAFVSAPILAAGIVAATPVVDALLPSALGDAQTASLARAIGLLGPWLAAALLLNFAIPGLFAIGRSRTVNLLAPVALAVHLAVTVLAAQVAGVDLVIAAMVVAPLSLFTVLVVIGTGAQLGAVTREIVLDTVRAAGLAAVAFAAGLGVSTGIGLDGIPQAAVTLIVGGALYAGGLFLVAPRVVQVLLGAGRGGSAESTPTSDD